MRIIHALIVSTTMAITATAPVAGQGGDMRGHVNVEMTAVLELMPGTALDECTNSSCSSVGYSLQAEIVDGHDSNVSMGTYSKAGSQFSSSIVYGSTETITLEVDEDHSLEVSEVRCIAVSYFNISAPHGYEVLLNGAPARNFPVVGPVCITGDPESGG